MNQSLQAAIDAAGGVVPMLRNNKASAHAFPVQAEFTNWRSEQAAWRDSVVLLDQSHHMADLWISGPDAVKLVSDFGVNTFAGFGPNRAKQYVAVNAAGKVIGDAILFHLEEGRLDIVGHTTVLNWLQFNAEQGGYDVELERDDNSAVRRDAPPKEFRYEIQGPNAKALIEKASGQPFPDVKFFHMADLTIAGVAMKSLRHGMAGQPGLEMWGPWAEGERVLEALLEAGEGLDLQRAGAKAYSTANLESGWVPAPPPALWGDDMAAYRQWLPATAVGSLGGSMDSDDIDDYLLTPAELDYAKVVRFDHDFHGREALEAMADRPQRTKCSLIWNAQDIAVAMRSLFETDELPAKYIELPKARYGFYQADQVLDRDGGRVGVSMDVGYIPNERAFVSLAAIDAAHAAPGTEVSVLWGESPNTAKPGVEAHRQVSIRATVAPIPFARAARDDYRK